MHFRTLFFFTAITINYCSGMELELPERKDITKQHIVPHIILLNGTTTAGKTSIAGELKKQLETQILPVEVLALDTFCTPKVLWALGINRCTSFRANASLITPLEMEEMIKKSHEELCTAVRTAYEQGKVVIVDTPAYRKEEINFYQQELADLHATWSLVYCPVSNLVDRVIERNKGEMSEQRSVLQALDQFRHLYTSKTLHPIDTLSQETFYATCDKARQQHDIMQSKILGIFQGIQNAICPFDLNTIQESMLENLSDDNAETKIGPVVQHDCIVNTKLDNPAMCALKILSIVRKKQIQKTIDEHF